MEEGFQMADNKTEHRGDMGRVAKEPEKKAPAGQKGSQRTQGGHTETQPSQSGQPWGNAVETGSGYFLPSLNPERVAMR